VKRKGTNFPTNLLLVLPEKEDAVLFGNDVEMVVPVPCLPGDGWNIAGLGGLEEAPGRQHAPAAQISEIDAAEFLRFRCRVATGSCHQ
jgi:hypothetical protein